MVLTEFDEKKYLEMMKREEWKDGHAAGLIEGQSMGQRKLLVSMLKDLGEIPNGLYQQLDTLDEHSLKSWTRMASRVGSIEEFLKKI